MAYPELLALIDYKLARLREARALLAEPGVSEQMLTEIASESGMNPASASEEFSSHTAHPSQSATTAEAPLEPQNAAPVPRIVARSRRFERRGPRGPRKPAESLPSALRSAAPAGPVFVPAAEVHRPAPPAVEAGQAPPPAEPLSAALLARRWLNATS